MSSYLKFEHTKNVCVCVLVEEVVVVYVCREYNNS